MDKYVYGITLTYATAIQSEKSLSRKEVISLALNKLNISNENYNDVIVEYLENQEKEK